MISKYDRDLYMKYNQLIIRIYIYQISTMQVLKEEQFSPLNQYYCPHKAASLTTQSDGEKSEEEQLNKSSMQIHLDQKLGSSTDQSQQQQRIFSLEIQQNVLSRQFTKYSNESSFSSQLHEYLLKDQIYKDLENMGINQFKRQIEKTIKMNSQKFEQKDQKRRQITKKILINQIQQYCKESSKASSPIIQKLLIIVSQNINDFQRNKEDQLSLMIKKLQSFIANKKTSPNGKQYELKTRGFIGIKSFPKKSLKINTPQECQQVIDLKNIVYNLQRKDYSYFYTIQDRFEKLIYQILQKYDIFRIFVERYLKKLMDIIKVKYNSFKYSDQVYEKLFKIKKKIQDKIYYEGSKGDVKVYDHKTQNLYDNFIRQTDERNSRYVVSMVKDSKKESRQLLVDYMRSCPEYEGQKGQAWGNLMFKLNQAAKRYDEYYDPKKRKAEREFGQSIHKEMMIMPKNGCLGCQNHFISNWNLQNSQSNIKIAFVGDINQINANQNLIKEEICGMLNKQGGVLLFNCKNQYLNVIALGTAIKVQQKKQIQQTIMKYLQDIQPKPKLNQNVILSFVPIMQSPLDPLATRGERKRDYSKYYHVVRLVIKPDNGSTIYYWNRNKPTFTVRFKSIVQQGKKQLKGKEMYEFIYNKNMQFAHELFELQSVKQALRKPFSCFNHKCLLPDVAQFLNEKVSSKDDKKDFPYASLLICKSQYHQQIQNAFRKHSVNNLIQTPYNDLKLRSSKTSAIIYHDKRSQQLVKIMSDNDGFQFEKKQPIIMPITDYVKLAERNQKNKFPLEDFKSLTKWLKKKYPDDKLEIYEFLTQNGEKEYFIKSNTAESRLYLFMVLSNFQQKASFRNPTARNPNYNIYQNLRLEYQSQVVTK